MQVRERIQLAGAMVLGLASAVALSTGSVAAERHESDAGGRSIVVPPEMSIPATDVAPSPAPMGMVSLGLAALIARERIRVAHRRAGATRRSFETG